MTTQKQPVQPAIKYHIDTDTTEGPASISLIISDRRCYQCQQGEDFEEVIQKNPAELIEQINAHCATTSDYLLPDTPLKEAVFRLILAGGNQPIDAEEVSKDLTERWAMSAYPRDVSPTIARRLLDNGEAYGIAALPPKDM
jgi:hypothetical protein